MVKVVIAEDNKLFRDAITHLVNSTSGFYTTGVAKDGTEAIQLVEELQPDLLILDLSMPKLDGFSVMDNIRKWNSTLKILVVTNSHSMEHLTKALKSGAQGFCSKSGGRNEILEAIETVMKGMQYISPDVGRHEIH